MSFWTNWQVQIFWNSSGQHFPLVFLFECFLKLCLYITFLKLVWTIPVYQLNVALQLLTHVKKTTCLFFMFLWHKKMVITLILGSYKFFQKLQKHWMLFSQICYLKLTGLTKLTCIAINYPKSIIWI